MDDTGYHKRMPRPLILHEDRLFPADPRVRAIARGLYASVRDLPIISPHGHTDALWFADNEPFGNATELLLAPDHYLFRMLYSQGVSLESLGVSSRGGLIRRTARCMADVRQPLSSVSRHSLMDVAEPRIPRSVRSRRSVG